MNTPDNQYGRKRVKKTKILITPPQAESAPGPDEKPVLNVTAIEEAQLPMELPVPETKPVAPIEEFVAPPPVEPKHEIESAREPKSNPEPKPEPKSESKPEPKPEIRREISPDRPRRDNRKPDRGSRPDRSERFRPQQQQQVPQEKRRELPPLQSPQQAKPKEHPQPRRFGFERSKVRVSIIIPAYNEEGNIKPLMDQFHEVIVRAGHDWEVILVDDGSTDKTAERARDASIHYHWLRVVSYPHNRGLTAALDTGFQNARGTIYVFYPADMQYHPQDIPKMIARIDRGADIVTGWKQGKYNKRFVSSIYNFLCRALFHIKVHDLNSVKAFKKEVLEKIMLRQDWHRYMVVLAAEEGYSVDEVKVNVFPRYSGKSKFGTGRILGGVLDLLSVKFQISFTKKPLRFFGTWGLVSILLGILTGLIAIYLRIFTIHGSRTWLYLVILFILSGLMLFSLGFLAEVIVSIREEIESLKGKK
jgi:glycosyltransferase involved in cell wall biosynthesis